MIISFELGEAIDDSGLVCRNYRCVHEHYAFLYVREGEVEGREDQNLT